MQFAGNRKLLVIPRGFLKSTIASRLYPGWKALNDPSHRTLIAGNSSENARKRVQEIMADWTNEEFNRIFPEVCHKSYNSPSVRWSPACACIKRPTDWSDGTWESAGVKKKVTGLHKNLIIEDDTTAPELEDLNEDYAMPSKDDIEKAIGWHKVVLPILISPVKDERVVVTTRWCFYDIVDWILTNEPGYEIFTAPAEDINGEILYPKRFPKYVL